MSVVTQAYAIAPEAPVPAPVPAPRRRIARYAAIGTVAVLAWSALSNLLASPSADRVDLPPATSTTAPSVAAATGLASTPAPASAPTPTFGPTGPTQVGIVTRVVDGDTIRVQIDGTEYPVRYIGMDTPEPDTTDPAITQLADAATVANAVLVDGREVVLERDVSETDQFDRLLRNVWITDTAGSLVLVNLELIRQGFAQVSTYPPDVKYVDLLTQAQDDARTATLGLWAPAPTTVPKPSTFVATNVDPLFIVADAREQFGGAVGSFTWSSIAFEGDRVTVRWSATATSKAACRVGWQLQPATGDAIKSTIRVTGGDNETGNRRYDTPFSDAALIVASTCGKWSMSMEGYEAPVAVGGTGGGNCDSSYPGVCMPAYPPDLDCGDVSYRRFEVRGPDPHGFDSDNDGIGCESG